VLTTENVSISDVIAAWDKGESIWAVEMGGLGPGYEQAIQVLIVELLRDQVGKTLPKPKTPEAETWGDETVSRIDKQCYGFSGAQVGAAKSVAYRMLRDGYHQTIDSMREHDKDRLIQVSNRWPAAQKDEP
jgi:hypothetical protein